MQINNANLRNLGISFNAAFQSALGQAPSQAAMVSTEVPSSTKEQDYGWIGKIPSVRKWAGDRVVQNISNSGYTVKNEPWELTIGVDRDDIEDDNLGIYAPLFSEMGLSTAAHKDQLVFGLLAAGFVTACFDGQPYFSTAHPVLDVNGNLTTYANTDAEEGDGPAWFLMATQRFLKPIIFQNRRPWNFVSMDKPDDENVFMRKEFIYGSDSRSNVGYGFPQFCWGSKAPLTPDNYGAAREALMSLKGDYGRPLGIVPDTLVYAPTLDADALQILNAELVLQGGAAVSNVYKGTAKPVNCPWLA
ncbi:MAG TPA: Mu-like prophage major head subunit gpT family protein [Caulobacteraceae bacterium]|nr:Mu-like prophage major head subunit gpT family protein [Caulobacteraceae bacterium]